MFPNIPIEMIKAQVERTGSPSRAVEQLLLQSQQYPMNPSNSHSNSSATSNVNNNNYNSSNTSAAIGNRNDIGRSIDDNIITGNDNRANNQKKSSNTSKLSTTTNTIKPDTPTGKYIISDANDDHSIPSSINDKVNIEQWKDDPKFRESLLLNRKRQMLLKARQKFVQKQ